MFKFITGAFSKNTYISVYIYPKRIWKVQYGYIIPINYIYGHIISYRDTNPFLPRGDNEVISGPEVPYLTNIGDSCNCKLR